MPLRLLDCDSMFYSRDSTDASMLRFIVMFVMALGLAVYFLATDTAYDRAGVMLLAAALCGGNVIWKAREFEDATALKQALLDRLRGTLH